MSLRWRHNERDCFLNHQPGDCLLHPFFGRRSKETSKLSVTGLCAGNSPGTGEFLAQMVSDAENVSIWWPHHGSGMVGSHSYTCHKCSEPKEASQNGLTPNTIGICSYCVLDRPVFEWSQTLLHWELTPCGSLSSLPMAPTTKNRTMPPIPTPSPMCVWRRLTKIYSFISFKFRNQLTIIKRPNV